MDPLKRGAERVLTDRRRRPTSHPWADAYLRAHGIEDAALRAEILAAILARAAARTLSQPFDHEGFEAKTDLVMEEAQRFLDEQLASFVGGISPGQEAIAGRLVYWLAGGPAQAPDALLDPTRAPAALRFRMRTARIPRMHAIARASMASRRAPEPVRPENPRSQRWLSLALCLLSLVLLTCQR